MFDWFKKKPKPKPEPSEEEIFLEEVFLWAKGVIEQGVVVDDNSDARNLPFVKFKDLSGNTLYICWYATDKRTVRDVYINDKPVPSNLDSRILRAAKERIRQLQLENLKATVESVKEDKIL